MGSKEKRGRKEEHGVKEEHGSKEERYSKEKQRDCLKNEIKNDFGNVFYTYVAHHKTADRLECIAHWVSLCQIALIAITSTGILVNLSFRYSDTFWVGVTTSVTSVLSLFLKLSMMEFRPHDEAIKRRNAADDLWKIKKEYISLLTDFNSLEVNEIQQKRGRLSEKVADVNKHYPAPDPKSYKKARKSIKRKSYTFDEGEIDDLLPRGIE